MPINLRDKINYTTTILRGPGIHKTGYGIFWETLEREIGLEGQYSEEKIRPEDNYSQRRLFTGFCADARITCDQTLPRAITKTNNPETKR